MAPKFLTGIDLTNNRGINVASPTAATDAANKAYVDALIAGLSWKDEVRAATTTAGTLATSFANGSVIDTVTLATADRILIKNQASAIENGIYTVNASGAPTRTTDADTAPKLNNATVLVTSGTVNIDTAWTQTTANPTVGSSNIVFVQFGAGQSYTAGNGLSLSTNTFAVLLDGAANSGLAVSGSGTKINPGSAISTAGGNCNVLLNATNPALTLTGGLAVIAGTGITVAANTVAIDLTSVTRKFSASVGNASLSTFTVTHNLNTQDVLVQVYDNSTFETVFCDVTRPTVNTVVVTFSGVPTTNQYRVVVHG